MCARDGGCTDIDLLMVLCRIWYCVQNSSVRACNQPPVLKAFRERVESSGRKKGEVSFYYLLSHAILFYLIFKKKY